MYTLLGLNDATAAEHVVLEVTVNMLCFKPLYWLITY